MRQVSVYEASDGEQFSTLAACKAHEDKVFVALFVGLDQKQVIDGLAGADVKLASAFERAGAMIAKKRRENGELKRAPNNKKKS